MDAASYAVSIQVLRATQVLNVLEIATKADSKLGKATTQLNLSPHKALLTPTLSSALRGLVYALINIKY